MKIITISISWIITIILVFLTNHHGDLDYYINEKDNSLRNNLISFIIYPLTILSTDKSIISYLWASIFSFVLIRYSKYLTSQQSIAIMMLSPFFLVPSKEGLVLIISFLAMILIKRGKYQTGYLMLLIVCLIRPFFAPLIISIIAINYNKRYFSYVLIAYIIALLMAINFEPELLQIITSYSVGYYQSSEFAGTTDWLFLDNAQSKTGEVDLILEILIRSLIPIWMLNLGFQGKIYFIWYIGIIYFTVIILYKNSILKKNYSLFNIIFFILIGIIPGSVLLVTNAGSAVRYLSPLPFLIAFTLRKIK